MSSVRTFQITSRVFCLIFSEEESLSTAAIVGIAIGSLIVVAVVGGVIAGVWYNFSKRSGRVESLHINGKRVYSREI